jgi:hypothetical protein
MPRTILVVTLLPLFGIFAGCGENDTSLGETDSPVNGVECEVEGDATGTCSCVSDGRWLCAGQNSVTCASTYGSGGGRLLVNAENGCEMEWGWNTPCSDGRSYGVLCNGLQCACTVNGEPYGKSFFSPRCAELDETNAQCGFSLKLNGEVGSAPHQGYPCKAVGTQHQETGCVCASSGWDCPTLSGCRLAGAWGGTAEAPMLVVDADGTLYWPGGSGLPSDVYERETSETERFWGTWQLEGTRLFVRTIQPPHAGCDPASTPTGYTPTDLSMLGVYEPTFENACSTLRLDAINDACGDRIARFDGFRGARH